MCTYVHLFIYLFICLCFYLRKKLKHTYDIPYYNHYIQLHGKHWKKYCRQCHFAVLFANTFALTMIPADPQGETMNCYETLNLWLATRPSRHLKTLTIIFNHLPPGPRVASNVSGWAIFRSMRGIARSAPLRTRSEERDGTSPAVVEEMSCEVMFCYVLLASNQHTQYIYIYWYITMVRHI